MINLLIENGIFTKKGNFRMYKEPYKLLKWPNVNFKIVCNKNIYLDEKKIFINIRMPVHTYIHT